jgi:DNA-nicking Smr family endonuclease
MNDEFWKAVADVEPLRRSRRVALARPAPPAVAEQRRRDELAALAESLSGPISAEEALETGEELAFVREGMSRQVLRRLRRAHWVVEESLDLHGLNRREAIEAAAAFLRACVARGLRCVRIVHGKGLGSHQREPVLKARLRRWLPMRQEVLACCQAPAAHGGAGAVLLLLRPRR